MPDKCVIFGCNNQPSKTDDISLHILYLLKALMNHKHKHLPGISSEVSCSLEFDEPLTSKSHSTSVYVTSESELES